MKKLNVLAATILLAGAGIAMTACGAKAEAPVTYTGYRMGGEAGYSELLFPITQDLVLVGNSYTYVETTLICHKEANKIVANHEYEFKGTFKVTAEDKEEGTKTIARTAPTYGFDKGAGAVLPRNFCRPVQPLRQACRFFGAQSHQPEPL